MRSDQKFVIQFFDRIKFFYFIETFKQQHKQKIRIENLRLGQRKIDRKKFMFKFGLNTYTTLYFFMLAQDLLRSEFTLFKEV